MKKHKTLQASPELVEFMEYHHLSSVAVLLKIKNEKMLQMVGFGWRLMKEVLQLRKVYNFD